MKMRKGFKAYLIGWLIFILAFNAVWFITLFGLGKVTHYPGGLWVLYACIVLAFAINLACADFALRAENATKLFLNIPIIRISYISAILTLIVGVVVLLSPITNWIGVIAAIAILLINLLSVIKSKVAAEVVLNRQEEVVAKTAFIKELTAYAKSLAATSSSEELKVLCERVYEAFRFSNPMSNERFSDLENNIKVNFDSFSQSVKSGDIKTAGSIAETIQEQVLQRNELCKAFKASDEIEKNKELQAETEKMVEDNKAALKRFLRIAFLTIIACALATALAVFVLVPWISYAKASTLMGDGQYEEAIVVFEELGEYKDCTVLIETCKEAIIEEQYQAAVALKDAAKYEEAIAAFEGLDEYKDSIDQLEFCKTQIE